jgi:hypothetical protein
MVAGGAPGRLRLVPRLLLFFELALNGIAVLASFTTWVRGPVLRATCHGTGAEESENLGVRESGTEAPRPSPPWARRVNAVAAELALLVHTIRMAIYLSPGRGRRAVGSAAHTFEP